MFIKGLVCCLLFSASLNIVNSEVLDNVASEELDDQSFVNLHVVEDVCPKTSNDSIVSSSASICQFKPDIHCSLDEQCKIGSKCCPIDDCHRMCIDLKTGAVSKPKATSLSLVRTQRRKRQSFGCVACAYTRNCRSDKDCRNAGRRKRCYKNSCSSYCTT